MAPVVVYPETDSKNASEKLKSNASMNGTAPSKLIADHISATIKKPSRLRIVCESRRNGSHSNRPIASASANVTDRCWNPPSS